MIRTFSFMIETRGDCDVLDITHRIMEYVAQSGIQEGVVHVFIVGSTVGLTTLEYEEGLVQDLQRAIERLFSEDIHYAHNEKWRDENGHSHIRASFLKQNMSVPILDGELKVGMWQQIVLVDFDVKPRTREVIIQVMGE